MILLIFLLNDILLLLEFQWGNPWGGSLKNDMQKSAAGQLLLGAAQLMNADVLMLDEPTGHLDVDNIKWLEDWLESFPGSIICTSHFSPFLDKMCTHIIDFQDKQATSSPGLTRGTSIQHQFFQGVPCGNLLHSYVSFPEGDHLWGTIRGIPGIGFKKV